MRIGEIQDLDLADVWDNATEELRERIYLSADRTKWGHAREVYLSKTTRKVLEAHIATRGLVAGPLFLSQNRKRFGRTSLVHHRVGRCRNFDTSDPESRGPQVAASDKCIPVCTPVRG
jgi:integrase